MGTTHLRELTLVHGGTMKILNIIKTHLDDGDCAMCPALFTMLSFVLGMIVGLMI